MQPNSTTPQTNWTVIPRGINNKKLSFAVFITPNQKVDTSTFDANFWNTWLTSGLPSIAGKGGTLNIAAPGQPAKSVSFTFPALPGDPTENSNAWAALLAYVPPPTLRKATP